MIVVADTSPLLHLARIHKLDLVPTVVGRVTIPRTVWNELVQAGTRADVLEAIQSADWIDVVEDPARRTWAWMLVRRLRGPVARCRVEEELTSWMPVRPHSQAAALGRPGTE